MARVEVDARPRGPVLDPAIRIGDTIDIGELTDASLRLRRQLAEQGYLWSTVAVETSVVKKGVCVRFRIDRGPAARCGGWSFEGNEDEVGFRPRLPGRRVRFGLPVVQQVTELSRRWYESRGYPFVQVRCAALRESIPFVFSIVHVVPGPRVWISFLEFAGSPGTRPALLARQVRFVPSWFSRAGVTASQRKLQRSGLVRVESVAVVQRDSAYGLRFWVVAERSNRASAGVGYDPAARRLLGSAQVRAANLFDTGRRLDAGWLSAYYRTGYNLSYTEPWVFGTGIDLTGRISHETEDTTVARTSFALLATGTTGPGPAVSFETGLDFLTDVSVRLASRTTWVGTGLRFDTRDYPANPTSGMVLSVGTRVGTRSLDSTRNGLISRPEVGIENVVPLRGRLLVYGDLVGRMVYSSATLSRYELVELGGAGSVRGYRDGQFRSDRTGVARLELRYLADRQSRVYPFFDCGVLLEEERWRLVTSWGLGTRAATRAGLFGLDFGVPVSESLLRGKVHFTYEVNF
ncbi:MAG: BamA/TamA family outer membrane protein [candidate division WOR-3 bacterium]